MLALLLLFAATEDPPTPLPPPEARVQAKDFAADLKLVFRAAACGKLSGEQAPLPLDQAIVDKHCAALTPLTEHYTEFWKSNIEPVLAKFVPRDKGGTVVYPFGGGDSVTALGTYPATTDLTTLSLELVGDPRGIQKLGPEKLQHELQTIRKNLELLFRVKHSKTDNLGVMTRGGISGQLVFALVAEVVRGYEPVGLRYFSVRPDGALDWLSDKKVSELDDQLDKKTITDRQHAQAFANAEIAFQRPGEAGVRLYRHINANLDNDHLQKDPGPIKYLESLGRVMAMTKAASYLLWWDNFSMIRQYLVDHMDYMISDSTGVPPDVAKAKGFRQFTFGDFEGPYLGDANPRVAGMFKTLWHGQPKRPIEFRYGYPDVNKNAHMLITTKLQIAGLE